MLPITREPSRESICMGFRDPQLVERVIYIDDSGF